MNFVERGYTLNRKTITSRQQAVVPSLLRAQGDSPELNESNHTYFYETRDISILEKADKILARIEKCTSADTEFEVADFTAYRGGVYPEAGFAHGLGLPMVLTCRKGSKLHFDIQQYNCIFWEPDKLDVFREALARRVEAVLGRGAVLHESK